MEEAHIPILRTNQRKTDPRENNSFKWRLWSLHTQCSKETGQWECKRGVWVSSSYSQKAQQSKLPLWGLLSSYVKPLSTFHMGNTSQQAKSKQTEKQLHNTHFTFPHLTMGWITYDSFFWGEMIIIINSKK